MPRIAGLAAALCVAVVGGACGACATTTSAPVLDYDDPAGDVRLEHPDHPDIRSGTFDLRRLTLARRGDDWQVTATFASPVTRISNVRLFEDVVVEVLPQTLDIYLDLEADAGRLDALPGRGFHVPAAEAWDLVLVISSLDDVTDPDMVRPTRITARGRTITAIFPGWAIPSGGIRGALGVVLATGPSGDGRVRGVSRTLGNCNVWDDSRCTLLGDGAAVLDATSAIAAKRPIALAYPQGKRPAPVVVPVVFTRGAMIGAAPVDGSRVAEGHLATVLDADGDAIATAVVLNVIGDTASLRILGEVPVDSAKGVVMSGVPVSED